MKSAWTVRTGKYGQRDNWALQNGFTGGGWSEVPDLTNVQTREEMAELVRSIYGVDKPSIVPNYTGQLWALRHRIQVGDLMVLPLKTKSQIALGVVSGPYRYLADQEIDRRHVIPVEWKRIDVPRTAIKQDLLYIIGSALTVFQASKNNAAERLWKVMETGVDAGSLPSSVIESALSTGDVILGSEVDLEDYATTRIETLIQENFAGHDLARLVEALLVAEGFVCELKAPGPDGGVDILAGKGLFGLDSPRIVVQVKSDSTAVGDPVLQTLQGAITRFDADQALLVAWSGVTKSAQKYLETAKFNIRLWAAQDVIQAVFKAYERLPEDIRTALPLKQIWIPVE